MMKDAYAKTLAASVMCRFPDATTYPGGNWSYAQGFMLWGMLKLYDQGHEPQYLDYVQAYCEKQVEADGRIPRFTGCSLDDMLTGSILVEAWRRTGKDRYQAACRTIRHAFDDYPRNSDGGFWHMRQLPGEMWVDGLFMGLMFLLHYGRHIDDEAYCFSEIVRQLTLAFERCGKDGSGLLYHAYSENPRVAWAHPVTGKSPEVWSEGLGWYALILAEALSLLPRELAGYGMLLQQYRRLMAALIKTQDASNGLWYQVVDKPRHPRNFHDTSGSAMFLYAMLTGIRAGLLPQREFEAVSLSAWRGLQTKCVLDASGNADILDACDGLGVQPHYDEYVDFPRTINAKEAVAAYLWVAAAIDSSCI